MPKFQPGHPKYGGKKKGYQDEETRQREQQYEAALLAAALTPEQLEELTPIQVMRSVMRQRYQKGDLNGALAAADKLAPYVHARLASVDLKVEQTYNGLSDEQLAAEIQELQRKIAETRAPTLDGVCTPTLLPVEAMTAPAN